MISAVEAVIAVAGAGLGWVAASAIWYYAQFGCVIPDFWYYIRHATSN